MVTLFLSFLCCRLASPLARSLLCALLLRDLAASATRFREANGNRLFAARDAAARAAALEGPALALPHRAFDLLPRLFPVFSHAHPPYAGGCMRDLCRTTNAATLRSHDDATRVVTRRRESHDRRRCRRSRCRWRAASGRAGSRQIRRSGGRRRSC